MVGVEARSEAEEARFVTVRTKVSVPEPRPRALSRPQVVKRLEQGLTAKLTLVCAPTGWGKTSALAEWAASAREARFAWVSLDPGDDDELQFWRYVVSALAVVDPALADTAQRRLRSPVVGISDEILPALVNSLAEVIEPLVLVLDDFHVITRPEIYDQAAYLLDRVPRDVHVVVATRSDRGLRLGRLRAMGDLVELRDEQLRFSDDEAAHLLNDVHGLDLTSAEVAALQGRTEGWVAGLNLAALSLRQVGSRERILQKLPADERFLVDYLWNEVVLSQPRTVRHFLMRTAVLERLTGPLCDAVAERGDSEEMLQELERANLFVVPLDDSHVWFRYHHLFRDLLFRQLQRHAPDVVCDLHRRASTWYAEHGFTIDAIGHALDAGDVNYAASELEQHWLELYSAGQATLILDWIDRLPDEVITDHAGLALARAGIARSIGRLDEVEPWLQRAEAAAADSPAVGFASSLAGGAALSRAAYRLAMGDVAGALDWARRAAALEQDRDSPESISVKYFLGLVTFFDEPARAGQLLTDYLDTVPAGVEDVRRSFAQALLAEVLVRGGDIDGGERLARQALELAQAHQLEEHPGTDQAHIALGAALRARGDLEASEEQFERAAALAHRGGDRTDNAHVLLWLARVRADQGDLTGARAALDDSKAFTLGGSAHRRDAIALEQQLSAASQRPRPPENDALSDAELRVLRLFPGDLSYREMAQHLYVSHDTIRTHSKRIRRKLNASTRAEAVTRARELDLI